MDQQQLVLELLKRIDASMTALLEQQVAKEWYTTSEVADILGKAEYTVREWCRKGQVQASKAHNGRGWLIAHEHLVRLRNEGPIPEQQVPRPVTGK
jgi:hypothetical protein